MRCQTRRIWCQTPGAFGVRPRVVSDPRPDPTALPAPLRGVPTGTRRRVSIDRVSDAELVRRAREGDSSAFGELVRRHQSAAYRAARAVLGSHQDAEDAAQDAALQAYRRLHTFRGEASFKTWLLTITWHEAINRRRSVTRLLRRLVQAGRAPEPEQTGFEPAAATPTPEDAAAAEELRRAIRDAIRALPAKFRDTLLLAQSGTCSYDDIAAIVGAPLGTVKWRVSEARRLVRLRLRERGFIDV